MFPEANGTKQQIFFSYVQQDQAFAMRLADELRATGAHVWIDVRDARPGRHWASSIEQALGESRMMIVVLSPEALQSAHVIVEWQAYLEAYRPVIPVVARRCDLPGPLRTRRPVDFTRNFTRAFFELNNRLIEVGTRPHRVDPVIWTITTRVRDFREAQIPPAPQAALADPVVGGLRRMVVALRDRLRWAG
jgi:hypothetical protein